MEQTNYHARFCCVFSGSNLPKVPCFGKQEGSCGLSDTYIDNNSGDQGFYVSGKLTLPSIGKIYLTKRCIFDKSQIILNNQFCKLISHRFYSNGNLISIELQNIITHFRLQSISILIDSHDICMYICTYICIIPIFHQINSKKKNILSFDY